MLNIKWLMAVAALATVSCGTIQAQDCQTCSNTASKGTFGYPTARCSGGCGFAGRFGHSNERDELKEYRALVTARNDAWPKPFNCTDRQLYHNVWTPMIDSGFEQHCVLNEIHFDSETNELNAFGRHAVAGIMQNMPSHRKHVFVSRDSDETVSEARLASVSSTVNDFYGQIAPDAIVDFSSMQPASVSGVVAEAISHKFIEGQPVPNIPISSGSTSVSSSVDQ